MLAGFGLNVPSATPIPPTGMVSVEFEALLLIEILPVARPEDCGENFTLKLVLSPPAKVIGKVNPLMLNPVPLIVA